MLNFQNDADAFRLFVNEHKDSVFNLILNRVQHLQDAEEITQDVFTDVYKNAATFRGEAAVTTWLYRITINKCIDHLRKKSVRNKWFVLLHNQDGKEDAVNKTDFYHPGVAIEYKEKNAILFKAIKQLPEKQYTAWMLFEMNGLSYQEISGIMNISISSVESLLFRARQNLKKIILKYYPE